VIKEKSYLIIILYILSVTVCVTLYPVFISATAIGIMAFGDGFATLVGKKWGKTPNPIDRNKTMEGSAAFFVFSLIACFLAMHVTSPLSSSGQILLLAAAGSLVGALVEMFPFEDHRGSSFLQRIIIDDNFFVPIVGGAVMYALYHFCIIC
jgi:dolichol kinase